MILFIEINFKIISSLFAYKYQKLQIIVYKMIDGLLPQICFVTFTPTPLL